jgi:hypothetical protein
MLFFYCFRPRTSAAEGNRVGGADMLAVAEPHALPRLSARVLA